MVKAYLSLGSNVGNRIEMLNQAITALNKHNKIVVIRISSVYETAPVGYLDQDNFLNIALEIATELTPEELLEYNQYIEKKLKRIKLLHWGPRAIDIDIITFGEVEINSKSLTIPHKEALNRAFVLLPLAEITENDFTINKEKIRDVLKRTPHDNSIIWLSQETLPF